MKQLSVVAAAALALGALAQEPIPARQMNVTQGPDAVFDRPPADIFPALAGATPTGENGRVGPELVFWGFRQNDGRHVFFFACAQRPDLDCATRVPAICPTTTTVLETREASGTTVHRNCKPVGFATPGDVRPNCDDRVLSSSLAVGLVTCG